MSQQYSDEQIYEMLRQCKETHGVCTMELFDQMDDTCSSSLVMRRFGSWKEAKQQAGIDEDLKHRTGRKKKYEDQEILAQLRECARRNGGNCTVDELNEEDDLISPSVAIERFGSWLEAKEQAGLKSKRSENKRPRQYTDEDYYEFIRECERKHGKATQRLFNEDDDFPSASAVRKRFGTWSAGKEGAGLEDNTRHYDDGELLEALRQCKERYGSCTASRFASDDEFPSPETVQRRFGSWSEAKERAGV